jgi:membrane fusion protein, copper/silver efflux system
MKVNRKHIIILVATLAMGILLGWIFFGGSKSDSGNDQHDHSSEVGVETTYTCSMHPQIRQNEPGDCPICGMDLIPLESDDNDDLDPMAIRMSKTAMQLASVSTEIVGKTMPVKTLRLNGKIQPDERLISTQSSHFSGRIEKLLVKFTGEFVSKGQVIAHIYSPELVTAQEELLEALKSKEARPQLLDAAKQKLKKWKLSENQIEQIIQSGVTQDDFPLLADISGYITERKVNQGDYVRKGQSLYEITDLSRVWILLDVYESDINWIKSGSKVNYTVQSYPGEEFNGIISYIDPIVDPKSRVSKARLEVSNKGYKLKPEMFVSATVEVNLPSSSNAIVVPKSAVMWTGKRSVVYVKSTLSKQVSFVMRKVTLGPALGNSYVVEEGLEEGEEIAVNGTFSIDAAAQLAGKPSMMSPEGGAAITGQNHGSMQTEDSHAQHEQGSHASFKVGGNCGMCKERIEKAALSVSGVTSAKWDVNSQTLHLNYNQGVQTDDIHKAIARVGHDTEKVKAPDNVYDELPECCLYERFDYKQVEKTKMEHSMVKVAGSCGMCKDRIEKAALSVEGVQSASWDMDAQTLHLDYNPQKTDTDKIQQAIAKVGHDTEKHKASDSIYKELPECCLYDRFKY